MRRADGDTARCSAAHGDAACRRQRGGAQQDGALPRRCAPLVLVLCAAAICIALVAGVHAWWTSNTAHVVIDYGTSAIYTREDIDAAAQAVFDDFHTWRDCELLSVAYASDEQAGAETFAWLNGDGDAHYDESMMLVGSFRTGEHPPEGLAPNDVMSAWQWYLARERGGAWILVNQGLG